MNDNAAENQNEHCGGKSELIGLVMFLCRIKCLFFFHDYQVRHEILGVYTQTLTLDEIGDCGKEIYDVYLEQCDCCGKRRVKTAGVSSARHHGGIKKLKFRWVRYGKT